MALKNVLGLASLDHDVGSRRDVLLGDAFGDRDRALALHGLLQFLSQ
jgi:hypothetical protein